MLLPQEMLDRMHLRKGDTVYLVEMPQGLLVTPYDPDFAEAMAVFQEGAASYRNALRELAKWMAQPPEPRWLTRRMLDVIHADQAGGSGQAPAVRALPSGLRRQEPAGSRRGGSG